MMTGKSHQVEALIDTIHGMALEFEGMKSERDGLRSDAVDYYKKLYTAEYDRDAYKQLYEKRLLDGTEESTVTYTHSKTLTIK